MKHCFGKMALWFLLAAGVLPILSGSALALSTVEIPLAAGDPMADAEFGRSIAIDGDCVVVGAAEGSDNAAVGAGAAYVFKRKGGTYVQEAKLDPKVDDPDIPDGAEFGRSVAVKGNVVVVGARFASSDTVERAGAAYIYKKTKGAWSFVQKVVSNDSAPEDNFGRALALDNSLLVVTARKEDVSVENDGAAYVFRQRGGTWVQEAKLTAADSTNEARFGQSVAVRGNLIAVGARDADTPLAKGAGAVYLFSRADGRWTQSAKLTADDGAQGDQFAFNVAVSGSLIAAGARRADPSGKKDAGAVYLFKLQGTDWRQVGKLTAGDAKAGDELGHSVAMSGDFVAAGARRADIDGNKDQGAVYLFKRSGNQWTEELKITATDGAAGDEFAHSLSAHGNKIAVGANIADLDYPDQGAAYVYFLKE